MCGQKVYFGVQEKPSRRLGAPLGCWPLAVGGRGRSTELIMKFEALFFFGLNKQLGPILDWEIELSEKKISVNTENFETNKKGIFAVGDINTYPGKLDLILCGFHETTLAVQEAFKRINPGERVPFGYTTSNKGLQEKLKVNKS